MRVACLHDVHGNLPALEAALDAADRDGADVVVVGGDVVLGPMPAETLERLRALGPRARWLSGNCDRLVVDAWDGRPLPAGAPAPVLADIAWCATRLDRAQRDFLAGLPATVALDVAGLGPVRCCHATPRSDDELVVPDTPDDRAPAMFAGVAEPTVVCGHTHVQFDVPLGGVRLVNAGSVGRPFGAAGAHWLLLGPDARHVVTAYDLDAAAARVRATAYPGAAAFAARILAPPTIDEALALYAPATEAPRS